MSTSRTIITYREFGKVNEALRETVFTDRTLESTLEAPSVEEEAVVRNGVREALVKIGEVERKGTPGVLVAPEHKYASLFQSFLAEKASQAGKVAPLATGGLEAKFDPGDWPGWARSFFTWWRVKGKEPHSWLKAPAEPESFANNSKVALLSDWGSGLYGAPVCAQSIKTKHSDFVQKGQSGYGALIHLGDVYYSGTDEEVKKYFLGHWPQIEGAINRACNSNHEMYTGGKAYFDLTLPQFNQSASYFALQNDHWLLVGLDSAYSAPDLNYDKAKLQEDQVPWLSKLMQGKGKRKVILLSHHQPYSFFESENETLVEQLKPFITADQIFAWYWGHEHRCILYDKNSRWPFYGRCIGHGGFPYFRDKLDGAERVKNGPSSTTWWKLKAKAPEVPESMLLDGPNPYVPGHEDKYGPHGYVTLDFSDGHLDERIHIPDGDVVNEKRLA